MVRYTVAMANYNMDQTIERAVRSIHRLTNEQFEIVVIDDGSTDRSVEIVENIAEEFDRVRVVCDSKPYLNEVRASALEHAKGEYILHQLDADDEYDCCILDFVEIFHQIEEQVEFDPFLSGNHIHIGRKELFREVNYRRLGYNGDRDLWRRMIHHGSFIGLHHRGIAHSIGYDRDFQEKLQTRFEAIVTQLRSGISARSYARWLADKAVQWRPHGGPDPQALIFNFVALPFAFIQAERQGRYDAPAQLSNMHSAERMLEENKMILEDIESHYGIEIDRSKLSERGREVYDIDADDWPAPKYWLGQGIDIGATPS
jgi:glycosyltransferase involved in cell wall biosynthesis